MIVALDVGYRDGAAGTEGLCAVVAFDEWTSTETRHEVAVQVPGIAPYVPGRLFERELPCLIAGLEVLGALTPTQPAVIIVDGNVRLDPAGAPGLGQHLFDHLAGVTPVVGVAKNEYAGLDAQLVLRGDSHRALYVTAAGIEEDVAADLVRSMAGEYRLPLMLRRVDFLTRREPGA